MKMKITTAALFLGALFACSNSNDSGAEVSLSITAESPFALHEVHFNHPSEAAAVTDLGAKAARVAPYGSLVWDLIEKQKGVYDWSASDLVMTTGYGTGAQLFVTASAQNSLEGTTPGTGQLPKDMSWYLEFLKKAAERYDGDGRDDAPGSPKIDVIQIGNEVDGPAFWQDTPEHYALLLKESYKAIKSVAPAIKVAMAGTATPWGFHSFYKPVLAELNRLKDAPGDRYFDIFDLHWSGQFPGDNDYAAVTLDKTYELGAYIADVRGSLAAIGHDNVPVYITEMSDYSDSPAGYPNHTESYHAAAVVKRYLYALSRGASKIFWAGIIEQHNFGGEVNGYFDNVGLINNALNSDGLSHKKLAYYTYKKMVEMLEGSDWKNIQVINESGDLRVYKLDKNNKPVYAAWWDGYTPGAIKPVAITGLSGTTALTTGSVQYFARGAEVADYAAAFRTESLPISSGTVTVSLGEAPVFVEVLQ
ncbi:MAG: hypothetical protein A2X58_01900 [Nitrospirae bacterium GWC2_56_14]|nr:MAG: hypothetical protein A2X58_01900 [Nitrospirae bacterium GWC2_56_14]